MLSTGLAYVTTSGRGSADALLGEVAHHLTKAGWHLGGVIQTNTEYHPDRPCHMDLQVLGTRRVVRISQFLGEGSKGCRLDPQGLETAVALVEADLAQRRPDLIVLNKFGKHEGDGRGFRPVIAEALGAGIPVLTAVSALNLARFQDFAGNLATALPDDAASVLRWCVQHRVTGEA